MKRNDETQEISGGDVVDERGGEESREILTDQEREYLRAVVRLFGHRLGYIRKIKEYTLEELGL